MSVTYTTYLMLGIKSTEQELGINLWDDKWLRHIEGWEDEPITIIKGDCPTDPVYVGKVIANWARPYDDSDYFIQYIPNAEDQQLVDSFLVRELGWVGESAKLMFFVVAS